MNGESSVVFGKRAGVASSVDEAETPSSTAVQGKRPRPNVRPTAINALGTNSEQAAKMSLLAEQYKQPVGLVAAAQKDFEERAAADRAEKAMADAPKLAEFFVKEPTTAAILQDDLDNAAGLENLLWGMKLSNKPVDTWQTPEFSSSGSRPKVDAGVWDRTARAVLEGQASNRIATHGFLQMPLDALAQIPSPFSIEDNSSLVLGPREVPIFEHLAKSNREEIRDYEAWIKDSPYTEAEGALKVYEDFVRSSPQMATQLAIGSLSGGFSLPTAFMGTQIAGGQYAELTEDGVDGFTAFTAAVANTAVQLPLERLELGALADIFKASGGWQIAKNVGTAALTSFATELVQNYPDALTTLWAKSSIDGRDEGMVMAAFFQNFGGYTAQGAYEGALSLPWALLGGSGKLAYDVSRYRTLKQDEQFFTALDENAANSKVRQRLPQTYQKMVEHLTSNGPVDTLYIAPEGMRTAIGDENVLFQTLQDLGVTQEQFAQAEALGADLEVPVTLYHSKVAGTDVSLAMRGEIRTSPEGMTLREQASFEQAFGTVVAGMVDEQRLNLIEDDELNAALVPIEEELVKTYGEEGARANTALLRTRAVMAAEDWRKAGRDITPAQWLSELNRLRVEAVGRGNGDADLYHAAMYRNKASTVKEFMDFIDLPPQWKEKSYFDFGGQKLTREGLAEHGIHIGEDQARHIRQRHPDFTEWDKIPEIIDKGTIDRLDKNRVTGGDVDVYYYEENGMGYAVLGSSIEGKKKGRRVVVLSAFDGSPAGVKHWIQDELNAIRKNAASSQSAEDLQRNPHPKAVPSGPENGALDASIIPSDADGKTLLQIEARGSITFPSDTNPETLIRIFRDSADFSTFVHEIGHLFIKDLENLVATGMASGRVTQDLETLKAFAGEFSDPATLQQFYEKHYQPQREDFAERDFSSLTEVERDSVAYVAVQEKLADAFVQYVKEGKAPSPELRPVFQRFKAWLQRLYKNVAQAFPINDEVRGVFTRMLATEQEIKDAEEVHGAMEAEQAALAAVAKAMLTEAEQARLVKAQEQAAAVSREKRLAKVLSVFYLSGAGKQKLLEQVREEVNSIPVYAAMDTAIRQGGIRLDDVSAVFGADTSRYLAKKRPGMLRKKGGVSLDDLAVAHDFASADALVEAMMTSPGKVEMVKAKVLEERNRREKAIREELGLDNGLVAGEEEYYSEDRLASLELQARALRRKTGQKKRNLGTADTLRSLARTILEAMPYKESRNIGRMSAAEAKQAGIAAKALANGDMKGAAEAKRRQAINHAMVLEAMNYRHEEEAFGRALRRYLKSKKMVFAYQEQIRALAERFRLLPHIKPQRSEELASLRDFVESAAQDNIFEAPPFQDFLYSDGVPQDLTLDQMREIRFAIKWLAEEGNPGEATLVTEKGKLADSVSEGIASLEVSGNTYVPKTIGTIKRKIQDAWQDFFASLDHTKFMLMAADGYQEIGKGSHKTGFHSRWHNKVMDAQNAFNAMFRKARPELERIAKVRDAFIERFKQEHGGSSFGEGRAVAINGVQTPQVMREVGGTHWTAEHIWCMARNMGNAGNLKTLTKGYGLTDAQLLTLTSILTKDEWLAIQAEGELIGGHFADTDNVFRQIYSKPMPGKVEPQPLTVKTTEGEALDLPGWYFPISVDGSMSPDIGDKQGIDMITGTPEFTAFGPTLAKGHTKARTGTAKPVALSFRVFDKSLQDQWRFLTHAPVVRDFDRITRNADWRKAYTQSFGPEYYQQLRTWLKYVARPETGQTDVVDRFMNNERKLSTVFILGLNFGTMIRQFQGYFQATPELGKKWILKGISRAAYNPMALVRHINEQSLFLADRDKNFVRELRKSTMPPKAMQLPFTEKKITMEDVQEVSMALISFGDRLTTYPVWQGAYCKATEELHLGHDQAVEFANGIIQKTQASNTAADLNQWQREDGKSWRRLYSMFMSEALRKGSRMRYYWRAREKGQISTGEYVNHLCMESIAPALFYVGVRALMTSSEPEPEDVLEQVFNEIAGPIPFVSNIAGVFQYGKDPMASPAATGIKVRLDAGKNMYRLAEDPTSEKAQAKFFKSLVDMAAFQTGAGNVRRVYETAAEGAEDIFDGETMNPFRLFMKKPKERR